MLGFAVLGAGRIGRVHARAIAATAGARLVSVSDPVTEAADAVAAAYGCDVRSVAAIETADDVDAVVICTPTDTHADLIERFARIGKAIFCEKPIDLDVDRVKACLAVVEETGARLMIGFNRRFDPDFKALRARIDAGEIGDAELVQIISRDPGPPPADYIARSGGLFRDMMIHDFDMARFLLGESVVHVSATGAVLVDPAIGEAGDVDTAAATLATASGRIAVITNSRRASYGYDQRIEVHGSKGMLSVGNIAETRVTLANADGFCSDRLLDFFMTRYEAAYAAEIAAFVNALNEDGPISPDGRDGLLALAIAEAAARSAAEGRTVTVDA